MNFQIDWNLPSIEKVKALLLVAHPDDETIFCGGTMLTYPEWEWIVVCVTEGGGNAPREEFENAIKYFKNEKVNVASYCWLGQRKLRKGMTDKEKLALKLEWKNLIQKQSFSPNIVFSHNEQGEYGNEDHKLLNKISNELFSNTWEFICPGATNCSQPYRSRVNAVPLIKEIIERKTKIFNHCYQTQLYNWRGDLWCVMLYEFKIGPEIFTSD